MVSISRKRRLSEKGYSSASNEAEDYFNTSVNGTDLRLKTKDSCGTSSATQCLASYYFGIKMNRWASYLLMALVAIALLSGCSLGFLSFHSIHRLHSIQRHVLNLIITSIGVSSYDSAQDVGISKNKVWGDPGNKLLSLPSRSSFDLSSNHDISNCRANEDCDAASNSESGPGYYDTSLSVRYKQRFNAGKDVKREAVAAMNIALDLQNRGRTEKAMKVFQQAVALDPSHADILTAFGEFLEWHVKDVVKADHMYHIALENSPEHDRALENRKRTAPIVEEIDQARFNRVDQKRSLLYTIPHNHPGLRRAKKEAYFAHIYHTNAIEGNTLTLAQTRSIVETRLAVGGKSLREQNEVLGLDSALSYINSTLVGRVGRLTMQDLLDIHTRVLGFVDPTEAGHFRHHQVFVGDWVPPPANELQEHMNSLLEWLNSEEALNLHPIELAALAHYRLVAIHPFYDGNGRTSRLLMNLILMQAGFPPVSIEVTDRLRYYETLQQGNHGDIRPFIRFIASCAERTLDHYLSVTSDDHIILSSGSLPQTLPAHARKDSRVIIIDNDLDGERGSKDNSECQNQDGFCNFRQEAERSTGSHQNDVNSHQDWKQEERGPS